MNWGAISAVAETLGTIMVLVTLIYLAVQMRIANKQREIESLRYNWDGINRVCELFGESTEKASIVTRGRESIENLTDEERLVFEFMYLRFLNTIESWFMQLMETSPPGDYREQQLKNIEDVVVYMLNYPGTREIWGLVRHTFVPVQELIDGALSNTESG